jgi:DNA repair protein RadA/Sms
MARNRTVHRCSSCGADHPRWSGRCDACGEWNTLIEEPLGAKGKGAGKRAASAAGAVVRLADVSGRERSRATTGIPEFDFVVGGGIVPGSMVLIGGEPGIGKSTLLLQVARAPGARA